MLFVAFNLVAAIAALIAAYCSMVHLRDTAMVVLMMMLFGINVAMATFNFVTL